MTSDGSQTSSCDDKSSDLINREVKNGAVVSASMEKRLFLTEQQKSFSQAVEYLAHKLNEVRSEQSQKEANSNPVKTVPFQQVEESKENNLPSVAKQN